MSAEKIAALLEALPHGQVMWVAVRGRSLSPLLRGGEVLKVERCSAAELSRGDLAVRRRADGVLVCHLVTRVSPLVTESTQGIADPADAEVLARALAVKRGGREWALKPILRPALWLFQRGWSWGVTSPFARAAWQTAGDALSSPLTATVRRSLLGQLEVSPAHPRELAVVLSHWETLSDAALVELSANSRVAVARSRRGPLGLAALRSDATLVHCWLHRRGQGLGLEARLLDAVSSQAPATRAFIHTSQRGFLSALEARGFVRVAERAEHVELSLRQV